MNKIVEIVLGATYVDKVTHFRGVATGNCLYLSGCNQVLLAPETTDGKHNESHWFDQQRLVWVEDVPVVTLDNGVSPGFDKTPTPQHVRNNQQAYPKR